MSGWIKVHRELMLKSIWLESTPEQKVILVTLLMMVNYQAREWEWRGERYSLKPGQVITSLDSIADKCGKGVSVQKVRTALKRFEKYGFLTDESTRQNRLITVVNWEFYQDKDDKLPNELTDSQQTINNHLATNKEKKEINNDNKTIKPICHKARLYDEASIHFQLSLRLFNKIKDNNAAFKEPDFQKWSNEFRLLIEKDGRTAEQIVHLIDWCQNDSFWKANILSPAKLRKQFDQLLLRAQRQRHLKVIPNPHDFPIERPAHWQEMKPLTKEEIGELREMEAELPY